MSERSLEERVAALEQAVAELQQRFATEPLTKRWWELLPPMTDEQRKAHEAITAYGRYFCKTGREAPPDWKPGDPIPDPEEWET